MTGRKMQCCVKMRTWRVNKSCADTKQLMEVYDKNLKGLVSHTDERNKFDNVKAKKEVDGCFLGSLLSQHSFNFLRSSGIVES